jgi:hypothetical protein
MAQQPNVYHNIDLEVEMWNRRALSVFDVIDSAMLVDHSHNSVKRAEKRATAHALRVDVVDAARGCCDVLMRIVEEQADQFLAAGHHGA